MIMFGSGANGKIHKELFNAINKLNAAQLSLKKGSEAYKLNQEVIDTLAKIMLVDDKINRILIENM